MPFAAASLTASRGAHGNVLRSLARRYQVPRMNTYTIVRGIGGEGFDVAIVSVSGIRRTVPNFRTEADAMTWIALDEAQERAAAKLPLQRPAP